MRPEVIETARAKGYNIVKIQTVISEKEEPEG